MNADLLKFYCTDFHCTDALTQAEKDTGSLKNSVKTNSRQGKRKQTQQKAKIATPSSSQSPRQDKDKQNAGKTAKNTSRKI